MRSHFPAYAGVAGSVILFSLCAPITQPWIALVWVALVPWLAALDRTRSLRGTLSLGLLMSVGFVLAVLGWFADAMAGYAGLPRIAGFTVLVLIAPVLEPQFVVFAVVRRLIRRGTAFWHATIACALAYVGAEWVFPKLFADTLGHGMFAYGWLRQGADIAGALGLTFVIVVVNVCVWETICRVRAHANLRRTLAPLSCALALLASLAAYGAARERQFPSGDSGDVAAGRALRVALVQADIAEYDRLRAERGTYDTVRMILDTHFAFSRRAIEQSGALDLLVWPETVYPTTFGTPKSDDGEAFDREIEEFVADTGVPLVFGSYDAAAGGEFNAAFFLAPDSPRPAQSQTYRKTMLFPLTERVPAVLESDVLRSWLPWLGTWKPGSGPKVIVIAMPDGRTLRVAPLICFDAVDPGLALRAVARGADLVVTLSNDSWFALGGGPWQHLIVSAFRSIETRRPQIRATNTGISAVVTPTGELSAVATVHQRTAVVATVHPVPDAWTLMLAWGNWFGPAACVLDALLLLAALLRGHPWTTTGQS